MYIYQVLIDRESNNMGLVPYNFDAEQINGCQHLIAETKAQPYLFSVWLQSFFRTLTTHLKYCFGFLPKIYVNIFVVPEFCSSPSIL